MTFKLIGTLGLGHVSADKGWCEKHRCNNLILFYKCAHSIIGTLNVANNYSVKNRFLNQ